ncbi:hypothetical protein IMCC12053_1999 [Celeribacter marinus]|uniref:Uncharacterized protein n=1 Tax=Celeribacter marinus TaxID=1397108 RepID=A0A0N9ZVF7_9RHOB|nr:hypothetical protein IMCC12053_2 [Celeribacter marinus]ALI55946.1 hypothetical protein IMCC12053_1999 [Celeribacter marinus]
MGVPPPPLPMDWTSYVNVSVDLTVAAQRRAGGCLRDHACAA